MAQEYRYCWLKMVEATDVTSVGANTMPTGLAAWACEPAGNVLRTFVGAPPSQTPGHWSALPSPPPPAPSPFPQRAAVFTGCKPCPAAPAVTRFTESALASVSTMELTPPPMPAAGWQIEGTPLENAIDGEGLKVFFSLRPVPGDRQNAIDWLDTPEGRDWLIDSSTCVLMSYFTSD